MKQNNKKTEILVRTGSEIFEAILLGKVLSVDGKMVYKVKNQKTGKISLHGKIVRL